VTRPSSGLRRRAAFLAVLLAAAWLGGAPVAGAAPPPGYGRAPLAGVVDVGKLLPVPAREAPGQARRVVPIRRVPGGPGAAAAAGPSPQGPAALAPTPSGLQAGASFAGIQDDGLTEPPDPVMAVGPGRLIELTNVGGRVFERNGTAVASFSLAAFFVPSASSFTPASLFDPTVVYDSLSGRFFAAAAASDKADPSAATATRFFVAVSQTSDPSGAWYQYGPFDPGANVFADFPHIGFSDDKFAVTFNAFAINNSNFLGNAVWVFDKADMTSGGAVDTFTASVACGALCYGSVRPAYALSAGATLYMAGLGSSTVLTVFSVTGTPGAANVSISGANLAVAAVNPPPAAPQKDSTQLIDTSDGRVLDAVWRGGHLWVAAGAACGSSPVLACAYYADVLTAAPMSVNANFTYGAADDGASGAYYFFPAITVGGDGTLYSVLSRSSATEYVSVRAFRRLPGQPAEATLLLKAGQSAYVSGASPGRWGDYYAAAPDPTAANVVWVVGQYAAANHLWGTWIAQVFPISRPAMSVDVPQSGATLTQPFLVGGWAIDRAAPTGVGVDAVHVWAYPSDSSGVPTGSPSFLGAATLGGARPDVGAVFGSQFTNSGFNLLASGLPVGYYHLVVYAHSTVSGLWNETHRVVQVVASPSNPAMAVDAPQSGQDLSQPFLVGGWAIDRAAPTGVGVDAVHVWAYPSDASGVPTGSPSFLGAATLGGARPDVGAVFGSQFTNSGFNLLASGLPVGYYHLVVYAHSTVSGNWQETHRVVHVH
jgi:hypothetical protein